MAYQVRVKIFPIDKKEILNYLDKKGIKYNEFFILYINHHKYRSVTSPSEVNFEIVNLSELGLKMPSNFSEIKEAALKKGFEMCDSNLGFYLRLALKNQTKSKDKILSQGKNPDSAINICSEKMEEEWEFPRACYLRNIDGDLWIRAARFDDFYEFPLNSEFAFVKNIL